MAALLTAPIAADASTATSTVDGGSLAFVSQPGDVTFNKALNGSNQVATSQQTFDVGDSTGSGAGWNITATSTTFASTVGGHTLANDSVSIAGAPATNVPVPTCDNGSTCTLATNQVSYPYGLPADTVAPIASKMFNADVDTGLGNQHLTPTWSLALPANTYSGTYQSTWTFSLVSGP